MRRAAEPSAFTLVEMAISLSISLILLASLLSMSVQTSQFVFRNDAQFNVQMEANRTFFRLSEVLRKSGRVELGGVLYPRVGMGGAALEFRILKDLDGNGYLFDAATGNSEWDPLVYEIRADEDGNLGIYQGTTLLYLLGRHMENLRFETSLQDSSLSLKQLRVSFETRRSVDSLTEAVHPTLGIVVLRN